MFNARRLQVASDAGPSCSNDAFCLQDLVVGPVLDSFIREKIIQLEQVAENIQEAKRRLFLKFVDVNKQIDFSIREMYCRAEAKREELKTQLREFANREVSSWNRQLQRCEEAEETLRNFKGLSSSSDELLQETCNTYAREIGFISSSEIFDDGSPSGLNSFGNAGNELCPDMIQNDGAEKAEPKFCIGRKGRNVGEFNRPWGICCDLQGRILVTDQGNNRIQVFSEFGRFLFKFGRFGVFRGEFNQPVGITVDQAGRVIVTDKNNHRVQVFSSRGEVIFLFGKRGSRSGQFQYPWDVDTNARNEIAISDTKNHRVQLFNQNGAFLSEFQFENFICDSIQSVCPLGVAFKSDCTLFITDTHNNIILKIDENFLTATKVQGDLMVSAPQGIACSSQGICAVADSKSNRVLIFDEEGLHRVIEVKGKHPDELGTPKGVCFHSDGSIMVVDIKNNRIQVF